jgi:hypothetical protein
MTEEGPEDPMTPLLEGAAQLKELYDAYVEAGFTPEQAMQLLVAVFKGLD